MADRPKWENAVYKTELKLRSVLHQLHEIWSDIGYTEEVCSKYCNQLYQHIEELLNDMITESQQRRQVIVENIKKLMHQITTISLELNTNIHTTGYENLPLNVAEDLLYNDLQKLQKHKDQRLTHWRKLLAIEKDICKVLGTQPVGSEDFLPSEEELNKFQLYLEKQEEEKIRVQIIFKDMRLKVIMMMADLGVLPTTNFEHLVYNDPENFVFNTNNMSKLRELRDHLNEQVENAKKHVESMKNELIALWKYLDEPEYACQSFIDNFVGYNLYTITALTNELARCKEKRKENIGIYITQVRTELTKLWDLCKYSDAQRQQFLPFYSQTYTEDLLALHELEVERVQKFYESNKPIFELFEERENLWMKMKELLHRANDPDRFHNRGGQLLMEEKERKKIQIKLPKVENQLKSLITQYELIHKKDFLINGLTIKELLKESKENKKKEKKAIKKSRKEAKDKLIKKATLSTSKKATLSSPNKIPIVVSTSRIMPLNSSKRKLLSSPSSNLCAKRRYLNTNNLSKTAKSGKGPKMLIRSSNEKENSISHSSVSTETTYNNFKEHLEKRKEIRSSLLPEKVLMNASKSGVKTLVKPLQKNLVLPTKDSAIPKSSQSSSINESTGSPKLVQSSKLATVSTTLPILF